MYVNVEIYNVEERQINIDYFDVDLNNVRQLQDNFVTFNVDFRKIGHRQNSVVNATICKELKNELQAKHIKNILEFQI